MTETIPGEMWFLYTPKQWLDDWGAIAVASEEITKENVSEWWTQYFRSRYTNLSEADWKGDRMARARRYMEKNIEFFEKGSWLISSSQTVTVGRPLALALYRFFGHATNEQVVNEPPPEIIAEAAQEHQDRD
jgi:hypothetical protein